jgi:hypothetical protein
MNITTATKESPTLVVALRDPTNHPMVAYSNGSGVFVAGNFVSYSHFARTYREATEDDVMAMLTRQAAADRRLAGLDRLMATEAEIEASEF